MKTIAIEGLPGAGKSTLIDRLRSKLQPEVVILKEPVEKFEKFGCFNPLTELYDNPIKSSAICQLHVISALCDTYRKHVESPSTKILSDRGLDTVPIFTNNMKQMGFLTNFTHAYVLSAFYEKLFKLTGRKQCADAVVYIEIPPQEALKRMEQRGRPSEKSITLEYLSSLKAEYDRFIREREGDIEFMVIPYDDPELEEKALAFLVEFYKRE